MRIIILVENGQFIREVNLQTEFPNTSFPANVKEEDLPANLFYCKILPRPDGGFVNYTQTSPELVDGKWQIGWVAQDMTPTEFEEIKANKWNEVRQVRDALMREFDWRYLRYGRQLRLNIPTTDSLETLDMYMQSLADVTNQQDPFNIVWPTKP